MVTKEPKTLRGMLRKRETRDGRKSTTAERTRKYAEETHKEVDKWMKDATGKSKKKKK